jgi:protoporphyrinogen oxidase
LDTRYDLVVLGAGPAGLTAALEAINLGKSVLVLEKSKEIGGISKTVQIDGWRFDLGGHRFFTKVPRVSDFWKSILGPEDFLKRPRLSRIHYRGKFFDYPLKPLNALFGLGLIETFRCVYSFVLAKIFPPKNQSNFEGWVISRFGRRLYEIFFKTYTEKVWGIPTTQLSSTWAAQRIKNLSLSKAVLNAFGFQGKAKIVTLIDSFDYPRLGPGMMWEECAQVINNNKDSKIQFEEYCIEIVRQSGDLVVKTNIAKYKCKNIISSIPLSELPEVLGCSKESILSCARDLKYRDFLTVGLVVRGEDTFPDNWIYIHSPEVKVGRIQNFRSWSPDLVKPGFTFLGLEYFVNYGDSYWTLSDEELVNLAKNELKALNLIDPGRVEKGYVVRVPKAYPVYDETYENSVKAIAKWLGDEWPQIYAVGRNGMHRYNNQDHSMLTAMFAVENAFLGQNHDLWLVNVDGDYHELSTDSPENLGGRSAPTFSNVNQ